MSILDPADPDEDAREPRKERAGLRPVIFILVVIVVLGAGGYAGAYALAGDNVPKGTKVVGVGIGGQSHSAAVTTLERELGDRVSAPISISVDGADQGSLEPGKIGVTVDWSATVDEAGGGRSWEPGRLWDYYTGGDDVAPVLRVDDATLDAAIATLEGKVGTPARDGDVKFGRDAVKAIDPVVGEGLDVTDAREQILKAYLTEDATAELALVETQPEIDEDAVQAALDDFANPAMSGPIVLKFGASPVRLSPSSYRKALSMTPEGGTLVPEVDTDTLQKLVRRATSKAGKPVDATVRLVKGKPRVVPAKPGVVFEPDDVNDAFLTLLTKPDGERTAEVPAKVDQPAFTTADARKLGVTRQISEFTTNYPDADYRNTNIGRAAELIDGTLLKPGESFSMNDTVGERTRENGFTDGFVISNGILVEDLGGGVSQMATTLFNAVFFAGLEDLEHKPHSFYIDRYPVGREATVAFGSIDLRFRNDSAYGVLISAKVTPSTPTTQGVVTVKMFSTKVWDIEATTSDRYSYIAPKTRTLTTADCYPYTGSSGFQVDVTRIFRKAGDSAVDHRENFHTNYTASDSVVCKAPPAPKKPGGA